MDMFSLPLEIIDLILDYSMCECNNYDKSIAMTCKYFYEKTTGKCCFQCNKKLGIFNCDVSRYYHKYIRFGILSDKMLIDNYGSDDGYLELIRGFNGLIHKYEIGLRHCYDVKNKALATGDLELLGDANLLMDKYDTKKRDLEIELDDNKNLFGNILNYRKISNHYRMKYLRFSKK